MTDFISDWQYRNSLGWQARKLLSKTELVYSGRFTLNLPANTRETVLLPIKEIQPLQQARVYVAVIDEAGAYHYNPAATLFTISDIGVSAHRYQQQRALFTQSLADGAVQPGVQLTLLNKKGQTLASSTRDDHRQVTVTDLK